MEIIQPQKLGMYSEYLAMYFMHTICVIIFHVYREATDVPAATIQTLELSKFSEATYE